MANLDLAKQIEVVHREPGFLRLSLPAFLCQADLGKTIEQQLVDTPGINSASMDAGWHRLSIRYDAAELTAGQVATRLFAILEPLSTSTASSSPVDLHHVQKKIAPLFSGALSETSVINFLNDLTAFYLVKAHWELITKKWLKQPALYSNAWLTTFYLIFLLIRYRKRSAHKPVEPTPNPAIPA